MVSSASLGGLPAMARSNMSISCPNAAPLASATSCSFDRKCRKKPPCVRPAATMTSAMPVAARPLVRNTLEAVATMRFLVSAVSILDFLILLTL
jgi:hypothetical protein